MLESHKSLDEKLLFTGRRVAGGHALKSEGWEPLTGSVKDGYSQNRSASAGSSDWGSSPFRWIQPLLYRGTSSVRLLLSAVKMKIRRWRRGRQAPARRRRTDGSSGVTEGKMTASNRRSSIEIRSFWCMNKRKQCSESDRSVHYHLLRTSRGSAVWFMAGNFSEEEKRLITAKFNYRNSWKH